MHEIDAALGSSSVLQQDQPAYMDVPVMAGKEATLEAKQALFEQQQQQKKKSSLAARLTSMHEVDQGEASRADQLSKQALFEKNHLKQEAAVDEPMQTLSQKLQGQPLSVVSGADEEAEQAQVSSAKKKKNASRLTTMFDVVSGSVSMADGTV
eukprot:765850-Hanusia_phi.AAC.4